MLHITTILLHTISSLKKHLVPDLTVADAPLLQIPRTFATTSLLEKPPTHRSPKKYTKKQLSEITPRQQVKREAIMQDKYRALQAKRRRPSPVVIAEYLDDYTQTDKSHASRANQTEGAFRPLQPKAVLSASNSIPREAAYYYLSLFVNPERANSSVLFINYKLLAVSYPPRGAIETDATVLHFVSVETRRPVASIKVFPFDSVNKERVVEFLPSKDSQREANKAIFPEIAYYSDDLSKNKGVRPSQGFRVFDFETCPRRPGSSEHIVYAYTFTFDGQTFKTRVAKDILSCEDLVLNMVHEIFERGLRGHTVYSHDFSRVRSVFIVDLVAVLHNQGRKVKAVYDQDRNSLISLSIWPTAKQGNPIFFSDSRRFAPGFVQEHAKLFAGTQVWNFPSEFVDGTKLGYNGKPPGSLRGPYPWNLQDEVTTHMQRKVTVVFKVITVLRREVKEQLGITLVHHGSTSAIGMAYYKKEHMGDNKWRLPTSRSFRDIRSFRYTGGLVHAPGRGKVHKKVYAYDVVSMYPSVIRNRPIPSGQLVNVDVFEPWHFGFVEVLGRAPKDKLPCLLPIRRLNKDNKFISQSLECVGPNELFSGLFLSSEVDAAEAYGYAMQTFGGKVFTPNSSGFKSFVDSCFKQRQYFKKVGNFVSERIYKSILNTFYGRFAMRPYFPEWDIMTQKRWKALEARGTHTVDPKPLPRGVFLVETMTKERGMLKLREVVGPNSTNRPSNTWVMNRKRNDSAVQVAAAITAHARVVISSFKDLPGNPVLFSHTDSVVLEHELKDSLMVGNGLGILKPVGVWTDFVVHPGTNWYAYKDENGKRHLKTSGKSTNITHANIVEAVTSPLGEPIYYTRKSPRVRDMQSRSLAIKLNPTHELLRSETQPATLSTPTDRIAIGITFEGLKPLLRDPSLIPDHLKANPL